MKKLICLIIVLACLFSMTGCGEFSVQTKKYATEEERTAFYENIVPLDENYFSFRYTINLSIKEKSEEVSYKTKFKVTGEYHKLNEDVYIKYDSYTSTKGWSYEENHKKDGKRKISEKGYVAYHGANNPKNESFFDIDKVSDIAGEKKTYKNKTTSSANADLYNGIVRGADKDAILHLINFIKDDGMLFIEGNNCKCISSNSDGERVLTYIFNESHEFKKLKATYNQYSAGYYKTTIIVEMIPCSVISGPDDKINYEGYRKVIDITDDSQSENQ